MLAPAKKPPARVRKPSEKKSEGADNEADNPSRKKPKTTRKKGCGSESDRGEDPEASDEDGDAKIE